MQHSEKREFSLALAQLFAIYGTELTDNLLNAWWAILEPYSMPAIKAAMNLHAGDIDKGQFSPKPADIRRHLELTLPALGRARCAEIINEAKARAAPIRESIAILHTEVKLGLRSPSSAALKIDEYHAELVAIASEPAVVAARRGIQLRDEHTARPRDRLPGIVRLAMDTLGGFRRHKDHE